MAAILGERQALAQQGFNPGIGPSLQQVWNRLPQLVGELDELHALIAAIEQDPGILDQMILQAQYAAQQQAMVR